MSRERCPAGQVWSESEGRCVKQLPRSSHSGKPPMKIENPDVEFVNLTPHEVTINWNGNVIKIHASGKVARVKTIAIPSSPIDGVPTVRLKFGEVEGLPEPEAGKVYIVSSLVLEAVKHRRGDVFSPDTSPEGAIRDEAGKIVGVRRLVRGEASSYDGNIEGW